MSRHHIEALKSLGYHVPAYANRLLYMFGGITLSAFIILGITGAYLAQFYNPSFQGAHASILYAISHVPLFDFSRGIHYWVANLVIILLFLHVSRVFITGAYKKPRRLTWLTGVGLLAITVTFIFIGTVLKWDQEGVEAFGHMQESLQIFGIHIGLTNGGVPIITQLYAWHISILYLILFGLLGIHLFLIKAKGISVKPHKEAVAAVTAEHGSSTFLLHLRRLTGFSLLFLTIAGLLALIFPAPIGQPGILDQEVTKPLWMFWPFYGLEDLFGLKGLVWGMVGFFGFLAIIPFIDRGPYVNWAKRKFIIFLGVLFLATTIGLGVYSRLRPPEAHLEMSHSETTKMATADELSISHQRLRSEAYYLAPTLVGLGLIGAWLARAEKAE